MQKQHQESFLFENSQVPIRAFSDIHEATLYEIVLSFYYDGNITTSNSFAPLLENKKSQPKLINTLLHLMKDPFSSEHFPNCVYTQVMNELTWKKVPITEGNRK